MSERSQALIILASRPETAEGAVERLHPEVAGVPMPEEVRVVAP